MARSVVLFIVVSLYCIGLCQAVNWNKLTNVTIAQVPPQEFRTLSASLFKTIPATAFSGLLPAQMSEIPPSAMVGFRSAQMRHLPAADCAIFSTEQARNLNPSSCFGFEPECIRMLSSQAFSAFTSKCVADFPVHMIPMLAPSQFGAIQPTSLRGLDCEHMIGIENRLVEVITPDMLSNMSRACCFLDASSVQHLREDTLRAITGSCIEEAYQNIFQNIGVRRFLMIPKRAYSGIRYDQTMLMDKRVVDSLSMQDLLETLSGSAMMGLLSQPIYLKDLMGKYGMNLVRNLTVAHIYPESYHAASAMKQSVSSAMLDPNVFVVHWHEISDRLIHTNWLEVYLLSNSTPASVFSDNAVKTMMESNFFGLSPTMFQKVPPHAFKYATRDDASLWTYDLKSVITKEIFSNFSVEAFLQIYPFFWYIPQPWIPVIPLAAVPHLELNYLYCSEAELFTPEQKAVMTPKQLAELEFLIKECSIPFTPPEEAPYYYEGPGTNQTPTTENIPIMAGAPSSDNPGLTVGGVFAIIFAVAVAIQSSVIGYHIYNKRRRGAASQTYDQL